MESYGYQRSARQSALEDFNAREESRAEKDKKVKEKTIALRCYRRAEKLLGKMKAGIIVRFYNRLREAAQSKLLALGMNVDDIEKAAYQLPQNAAEESREAVSNGGAGQTTEKSTAEETIETEENQWTQVKRKKKKRRSKKNKKSDA